MAPTIAQCNRILDNQDHDDRYRDKIDFVKQSLWQAQERARLKNERDLERMFHRRKKELKERIASFREHGFTIEEATELKYDIEGLLCESFCPFTWERFRREYFSNWKNISRIK